MNSKKHRKPLDALQLFKRDFQRKMRSCITADHPYITKQELQKLVFEQDWLASWKGLKRCEQRIYLDLASAAKYRYDQAIALEIEKAKKRFEDAVECAAEAKINTTKSDAPNIVKSLDEVDEVHNECVVCLAVPKTMLLRPCKHVATCANCSQNLMSCPICRSRIDGTELIYI
jgi:hypothetical protein